jgi:hypothetical protein
MGGASGEAGGAGEAGAAGAGSEVNVDIVEKACADLAEHFEAEAPECIPRGTAMDFAESCTRASLNLTRPGCEPLLVAYHDCLIGLDEYPALTPCIRAPACSAEGTAWMSCS